MIYGVQSRIPEEIRYSKELLLMLWVYVIIYELKIIFLIMYWAKLKGCFPDGLGPLVVYNTCMSFDSSIKQNRQL